MGALAQQLPWFDQLSADDRSRIAAVAEAGITSFSTWYLTREQGSAVGAEFFGDAPGHLTRTVTLRQTLEMIRLCVDLVERRAHALHLPGKDRDVAFAAVRFSRDVAFAAAEVYAGAAEIRGAWDARLEALYTDALMRGDSSEALGSLEAALGWNTRTQVVAFVGAVPATDVSATIRAIRKAASSGRCDTLVGVHRPLMVALVGTAHETDVDVERIADAFAAGHVVVAPVSPDLGDVVDAVGAAAAGWRAAGAWRFAPRPVRAEQLWPERALHGDRSARAHLIEQVYTPLATDPAVRDTVAAYFESGGNLEATARASFVHANTVRYRLRKCEQLTGCDPTNPRDALTLRLALVWGVL